jgi:hypothetical protein
MIYFFDYYIYKNRIGRWEAALVNHQKCTDFSGLKGRKLSSRKKSLRELMEKYGNVRMLLMRYWLQN